MDAKEVILRAQAADVSGMVTVASHVADARNALGLATVHSSVWCSAGVHPHEAATAEPGFIEELRELAAHQRVVAIGETGLDYHYDNSPRADQRRIFAAQLRLAAELSLPVIVHCRSADDDARAMIGEVANSVRGVLHCFASGRPLLETGLDAGWYVSFAGLVSFKNYADAELVRSVPEERLLIETDSPYLAPVPQRGKRNEPAFVAHVAEAVANVRGETMVNIASATSANARAFYRLQT